MMNTTTEQQIAALMPAIKERWCEISAEAAQRMAVAIVEGREAIVGMIYEQAQIQKADVVVDALMNNAVEALVSAAVDRLGIKPPVTGVR